MADLSAFTAQLQDRLEAKHRAREAALRGSRNAIRHAANAIRTTHRGERDAATALLGEARAALESALTACAGHPAVEHAGFIHDAAKEYAEAATTMALIAGELVPDPDDLGVSDAAWLNGLAESVGELRRHLLDELRHGRLERCEALLADMDEIYALLVTMDYPEGITAGLRRSTDLARSIIERTRGDLTTALVQDRLRDALEAHRRDMLEG